MAFPHTPVARHIDASRKLLALVLAGLATATAAQNSSYNLPKIDIYPRYPVSDSLVPGPANPYVNSGRRPVSVVVYSTQCPPEAAFDVNQIRTTISGNNISVSPVRFGYQPICGFTGSHPTDAIYSAWLGEFGPGNYRLTVSGEPGDGPYPETSTSTITTMVRDFVVLNVDQAAKAVVESPASGSTQSGIGLISGWACVADEVEISIDGGARTKVQGDMPRADVKPVCAHSTAGFGQVINFNTLSAGPHTIQAFVKGVAIGQPTQFNVVVPAGEFITGVNRQVTVTDFPSAGKTATLDWREAEQNFGLKDVR